MRSRSSRSYGRKPYRQEPIIPASGETFLVVVEGAATEPSYLRKIRSKLNLKAVAVEIVHGDHTDPVGIVKEAIAMRDAQANRASRSTLLEAYDRTWVVFDRERQNHPRRDAMPKAFQLAADNGIEVTLSIPTFEYWLLLHFEYTTKAFDGCEPVKKMLKKFVKDYEKGNLPLDELVLNVGNAMSRAAKCRRHWSEVGGDRNPSTDVDLLIKSLNAAAHQDYRIAPEL